jgi:1-acyl-sn-glycerol-3-phosphate acyltransferase
VLRRGELFGIFPEGTRSRDGYLYRGRTGAARLAMETGAPLYPVGITGTDLIQPPDAKAPKPFKSCTIEIGRPIRPERYASREPHLAWRSMIDEVMFEIREMTGQEYRNRYAGQREEPSTEERSTAVPASVADDQGGGVHAPSRELAHAVS